MGIAESWALARDVGGLEGRGLATVFGAQGSPMTVIYSSDVEPLEVVLGGTCRHPLVARLIDLFDIDVWEPTGQHRS